MQETDPGSGPTGRPVTVRIDTPDGHRPRFSESLVAFVVNESRRDLGRRFRLGDWIATLDDATLGHLQTLSEQAVSGQGLPPPAAADLLSVALHAVAAERAEEAVRADPDSVRGWHFALCLVATLERLRRTGLVEFDGRTSIEDADINITFTDKGAAWLAQTEGLAWKN